MKINIWGIEKEFVIVGDFNDTTVAFGPTYLNKGKTKHDVFTSIKQYFESGSSNLKEVIRDDEPLYYAYEVITGLNTSDNLIDGKYFETRSDKLYSNYETAIESTHKYEHIILTRAHKNLSEIGFSNIRIENTKFIESCLYISSDTIDKFPHKNIVKTGSIHINCTFDIFDELHFERKHSNTMRVIQYFLPLIHHEFNGRIPEGYTSLGDVDMSLLSEPSENMYNDKNEDPRTHRDTYMSEYLRKIFHKNNIECCFYTDFRYDYMKDIKYNTELQYRFGFEFRILWSQANDNIGLICDFLQIVYYHLSLHFPTDTLPTIHNEAHEVQELIAVQLLNAHINGTILHEYIVILYERFPSLCDLLLKQGFFTTHLHSEKIYGRAIKSFDPIIWPSQYRSTQLPELSVRDINTRPKCQDVQ